MILSGLCIGEILAMFLPVGCVGFFSVLRELCRLQGRPASPCGPSSVGAFPAVQLLTAPGWLSWQPDPRLPRWRGGLLALGWGLGLPTSPPLSRGAGTKGTSRISSFFKYIHHRGVTGLFNWFSNLLSTISSVPVTEVEQLFSFPLFFFFPLSPTNQGPKFC